MSVWRWKSFAPHDILSLEALPPHNEKLVGDALTNVSLNYRWRKIISEAIEQYLMNPAQDDITLDNQDLLDAFYEDMYNGSSMRITTKHFALSGNQVAGGATFANITGTTFLHTWQHSKATIEYVLLGANSGANNTWFRPAVNGAVGAGTEARIRNGQDPVVAWDDFDNLPIGTEQTISCQFRISGSTGTVFSTYNVMVKITEYD